MLKAFLVKSITHIVDRPGILARELPAPEPCSVVYRHLTCAVSPPGQPAGEVAVSMEGCEVIPGLDQAGPEPRATGALWLLCFHTEVRF